MGYLLAALLGGFFLFNSAATPQKAAHLAERALQKQYPGADIAVEIEGKRGASIVKGNFRRVRVQMAHLTLDALPFEPPSGRVKTARAGQIELDLRDLKLGQMPVSQARLEFDDVQYDFGALKKQGQFKLVRLGAGRLQLQLSAQALLPAFAAKLQNTSDVTVGVEGQTLTLRGNRSVLGVSTPIIVSGQLAGAGSELRLEGATLSLGGARVPTLAANALLKDLNPLYDFDKGLKWPFRTQITGASGQGNQLDISADLSLSAPPISTSAVNSSP